MSHKRDTGPRANVKDTLGSSAMLLPVAGTSKILPAVAGEGLAAPPNGTAPPAPLAEPKRLKGLGLVGVKVNGRAPVPEKYT